MTWLIAFGSCIIAVVLFIMTVNALITTYKGEVISDRYLQYTAGVFGCIIIVILVVITMEI